MLNKIAYVADYEGRSVNSHVLVLIRESIKAFEDANGVKVPYKIVDRRPGDIAECYADATKSRELLGWTAKKTLVDMCRDSWNWQSKNPNGYDA